MLAALSIGLGIAQRTVFALPKETSASVELDTSAKVTVIDGETLNAFPRSQTVAISGARTIFAAYGRTTDVNAWIGDVSRNDITMTEEGKFVSKLTSGSGDDLPSPEGSDLWYLDYTKETALRITINVPEDVSLIIMSDGVAAAPSRVSVTWPLDNSTPWAIPLVVGGAIVLLLGLALLFWAVSHLRSARGPRRKSQKMPKLPRQPRYKPSRVRPKAIEGRPSKKAIEAPRGRRSSRTSMIAVLPVVLVGSLVLGGCSTDFLAANSPQPPPVAVASPEAADAEVTEAPAVTKPQANRIIARISAITAEADTDRDAAVAATRLAGPALDLRLANYKMRKADKTIKALSAIPAGPVELTLPQQNNDWPRTVFAIVQNDVDEEGQKFYVAVVMIQDDARSQYKVHYAITLEPGAVIPKVASAEVGTNRLSDDIGLLTIAPSDLAMAYSDVLMKDTESENYDLFEAEGDTLRVAVGLAAKKTAQKKLPSTAKLIYESALGNGQTVTLTTNDNGALVAVNLNEIETVKAVEAGAAVNAPKTVKSLLGKSLSTKGIKATYGDQLLFYVPPATEEGGKIVLLGYSQGLIAASELK
ncbi:hypothetical protein EYE40_01715 [Glaciihabitans arcticus]|uniref:DUF8094 domain-containing protein n=1 Tax=Glaciihabitans arcticus TaxID=2668039 RepID=A0A4Q9GTV7_9MICO|nr:hypothetical protein EYE40_01715 [Glaciihabitans arcticus]